MTTKKEWVIDSGASRHVYVDLEALIEYTLYNISEVPFGWMTSDRRPT